MKHPKFVQLSVTISFFLFACNHSDSKNKVNNDQTIQNYDTTLFYLRGQKIFKADCNACHVTKGRLHNYLEGVVQRVGDDYLKLYLTKQDSLIESKDKYALRLKETWGNMGNSHNFDYTEIQLKEVIEYLR
jgi:hypothetical protein